MKPSEPIEPKINSQEIWESASRRKLVKKYKDKVKWKLTPEVAERCRYEIIDQTNRMAECYVCQKVSHGIRLHPPHLYNIVEGKVFYRETVGSPWVRWYPNFSLNRKNTREARSDIKAGIDRL